MTKGFINATALALCLGVGSSHAFDLKRGHFLIEAGAYNSTQGQNQQINIEGLIGDRFTVIDRHDTNALIGLGYMMPGVEQERYAIAYGINAFYLFKTRVSGDITQEGLFTNLAYRYDVSHLPVYAMANARVKSFSDKVDVTLNGGIGPNFIKTSHYNDWSLDGGMTIPDRAFSGKSKINFSGTVGIGVQLNNFFGATPLKIGYQFFYLGTGDFNKKTDQLLNTLKTGSIYANAVVVSVNV